MDELDKEFDFTTTSVIVKNIICKVDYVPPQPGWCSWSSTSFKFEVPESHPLLNFIVPENDPYERLYHQLAVRDGRTYVPRYDIKAVLPEFCFDSTSFCILAPEKPDSPFVFAFLLERISINKKEILDTINKIVDWLESGVFIQDTSDYIKLRTAMKELSDVKTEGFDPVVLAYHDNDISGLEKRLKKYDRRVLEWLF